MKAYLYCTKAKPYLFRHDPSDFTTDQRPYALTLKKENYCLNGSVCFECEIDVAERIIKTATSLNSPKEDYITKTMWQDELMERSCLTEKQLSDYEPKYVLFLERVKEVDYHVINNLYKRFGDMTEANRLHRMPQNICCAWEYKYYGWNHKIIISVQPQHLCNIANGLKTIEVRRQIPSKLKEHLK